MQKAWLISSFVTNTRFNFNKKKILKNLPENLIDEALKSITSWNNYKLTPLIKLNKLNNNLKIKDIYYKDESKRFHLKSFKALGGAFAVKKVAKGRKNIIISSATAGNHGRSVAWGAKRLGLKCKIFIGQNVSESRAKVMRKFGAKVIKAFNRINELPKSQ